jgi:glutaredoxin 3
MSKSVIIYTTEYCPHCHRAKMLLERKKIKFQEIDITNDEQTRNEIEKRTGWMTVPMIFIGEEFIGGADDLYALEASGNLDKKLSS